MLTFDSIKHQYFWNGQPVPGVSEILKETGQTKDWAGIPPYYRDRGTAVHKAISLWLKDDLDESSLVEDIKPHFDQFVAWYQKQRLNTPISEQPYYSEALRYAGTVDLICDGVIYDIKCSKKLDKSSTWQYDLQGGAYKSLVQENGKPLYPFKILLLTGEGEAQVVDMVADLVPWMHVVHLYDKKMGRNHA